MTTLYNHLAEHGPSTREEISVHAYLKVRHKLEGIRAFDPGGSNRGRVSRLKDADSVLYIMDEHKPRDVLEVWVEANGFDLDDVETRRSLGNIVGGYGSSFRRAWRSMTWEGKPPHDTR